MKINQDNLPPEPRSYREMLKHPHKERFLEATRKEIEGINSKNTYRIVDRPTNIPVIPVKWVYTYKLDKDGNLCKHKARLCARRLASYDHERKTSNNFSSPNL